MREASTGRTLAGTTFRFECRVCGADHDENRHNECPDCGQRPRDYYDGPWGPKGQFAGELPDGARFPFRADTSWASKRAEVLR